MLEQLIIIAVVSFFVANAVWTLEWIMQPGQILEFYGTWLDRMYARGHVWVKAIGYCAPCTAFWACLAVALVMWGVGITEGRSVLPMALFGLFWVRKIMT